MAVKGDEQVLARIGFAQRWLDRAKRQCTEGNLTRSGLTLVLADAEVHHALEAAGGPARTQTRMTPAALMLLSAALVSVLLLASRWPGESGVVSSSAPPLIKLSSSSGTLLEAMGALTAASRPIPISTTAISAGSGRASAARYPSPPGTMPQQTPRAQPLASGGTPPSSLGSSHISMSELIDLVLTAERALRREPAGSSSP